MNCITLTGNIGRELNRDTTTCGAQKVCFSVGRTQYIGGQEKTIWFYCVAVGKTAEYLSKYSDKGSYVSIIGTLNSGKNRKDEDFLFVFINAVDIRDKRS